MPKRKRHYIYCKKGLHILADSSRLGVLSPTTKGDNKLRRSSYVRRICKVCEADYKKKQRETMKSHRLAKSLTTKTKNV